MATTNLRDIVKQGDTITVTFNNQGDVVGTFESWRENYRFMIVKSGLNTHIIRDYAHAFVVTP